MVEAFRPVDRAAVEGCLDELGLRLTLAVADADGDPAAEAKTLGFLLGEQEDFRGAPADEFSDPESSFIDTVLRRRRGLPIVVSAVYLEVARRAGVRLGGIGYPGHYLVAHFGTVPPLVLDPYRGGCPAGVHVPPSMLASQAAPAIVHRMLNNLESVFMARGAFAEAARTAEMRSLLVPPDSRPAYRTRARRLSARLN